MATYGLIGPGNLGQAILRKVSRFSSPGFYHPSPERCQVISQAGLGTSMSLEELLSTCTHIFITVKPSSAEAVCRQCSQHLHGRSPIFISVMAGVPVEYLRNRLGTPSVCRMMVDLSIGEPHLTRHVYLYSHPRMKSELDLVLGEFGPLVWMDDEAQIDTATAVFGCGPAFVARYVQAYIQLAVDKGFNGDQVLDLFDASLYMLTRQHTPEEIIQSVACKGGATERGLLHLSSLDQSLRDCVNVAEERCHELRRELSSKHD